MDYYEKVWYSSDKEKIEEYKYIIMQNLNLEDLEKLSKNDRMVKKYMSEIERVNENPKFREYMSAEEDNRKIENSIKYYARMEGKEEGREEGREEGKIEGIKEKSIEVAKKLKAMGMDENKIVQVTNLSLDEIEKL